MESQKSISEAPSLKPAFSLRSALNVFVLLLLLLGLPIGGYLALNQTNFLPKAASNVTSTNPKAGFILETPKAVVLAGDSISVDVLLRSDVDEANLFVAKIKYPKDLLVVEKIDQQGSAISRFIESRYDNQAGEVSLIGGVTNPGLKTAGDQKYKMATVVFKAKSSGEANLAMDSASSFIYRNTDNTNILASLDGLTVNIAGSSGNMGFGPDLNASSSAQTTKPLVVISPNGGEVYDYLTPINITWEALDEIGDISISLLLNGQFLGKIGSNLANTGTFSWNIEQTLPVAFVNSNNTFQIEVAGVSKGGAVISDTSDGPFGISLNPSKPEESAQVSREEAADFDRDGKLTYKDLSLLFSNYNKPFEKKLAAYDLNQDGVVNDIDLFFLMNFLVKEGMIKT